MKKYLLIALFLLGSLVGTSKVEAKSLYDCYQSKGLKWTSVLGRAGTAAEHAVWKYRGTAEQNKLLSSRLCSVNSEDDELLGFSVISGYEKNLRVSMDATQTFVPVTSIVLKDGTTIVTSTFGGVIFLTIEPGTTREELVVCTGVNSTPNFTPCTRGLAFSGTSTASVSTNRKPHNAGANVVASNAHYVYEQFVDVNDKTQTIQGDKTATGTWTFTSGTIYIASSSFGLRVSNGMLQWSIDGFVNSYNFTSSTISQLVASSTAGINVTNNQIAVIVSTTLGMAFGPDGRLYQKTSSTLAVENDSDGIKINTTTLVNLIATGTPSGLKIPITNSAGVLPITWIATSSNNGDFLRTTSTGDYFGPIGTKIASSSFNVTFGQSYFNTSTLTKLLTIIVILESHTGAVGAKVSLYISNTSTPTLLAGRFDNNNNASSNGDNQTVTLYGVVPPSYYFRLADEKTSGTVTLVSVTETDL